MCVYVCVCVCARMYIYIYIHIYIYIYSYNIHDTHYMPYKRYKWSRRGHVMPCYTMLCYTILYYTILYYTIVYYNLLFHSILNYTTPAEADAWYLRPSGWAWKSRWRPRLIIFIDIIIVIIYNQTMLL